MAIFHVLGDDARLVSARLTKLITELVGEQSRAGSLESHDLTDQTAEGRTAAIDAVVAALQTESLFAERRVVVLRAVDEATVENLAPLVAALPAAVASADLIVTSTGRLPKSFTDALSEAGVTRVDTKVPTGKRDIDAWASGQFIEAGLKVEPVAVAEVVAWLGQDRARLPSLITVLLSTYGAARKLGVDEVRPFLGEQGGVAPWDLTDAIDTGRMSDALAMLRRMVRGGEFHPLQVMAVLHNHYTRLLRLDGAEASAPADVMGLIGVKSDFQVRKYLSASQRLGTRGVRAAIVLLAEADRDLRGAKDLDEELVLEILVARLARLVEPAPRPTATSRRR